MKIIALSRRFPLSKRYILLHVLPWLAFSMIVTVLIMFTDIEILFLGRNISFNLSDMELEALIIMASMAAPLLAKVGYALAYRYRFRLEVRGAELSMTKGVILRQQANFPLAKVTELYLGQDWRHFFLGLYFLEILTPGQHSARFSRIEGLSRKNALAIKRAIEELISTDSRAALAMAA